jgi:hypothetical protein
VDVQAGDGLLGGAVQFLVIRNLELIVRRVERAVVLGHDTSHTVIVPHFPGGNSFTYFRSKSAMN